MEFQLWTSEQIAILKAMYGRYSSTKIAKEISRLTGRNVSRNAVCGKCHRLGLRLQDGANTTPEHILKAKKVYKKALEAVETPVPNAVPFELHEPWMCLFPHEKDGKHYFCSSKKAAGLSYCDCHAKVVYRQKKKSEENLDQFIGKRYSSSS